MFPRDCLMSCRPVSRATLRRGREKAHAYHARQWCSRVLFVSPSSPFLRRCGRRLPLHSSAYRRLGRWQVVPASALCGVHRRYALGAWPRGCRSPAIPPPRSAPQVVTAADAAPRWCAGRQVDRQLHLDDRCRFQDPHDRAGSKDDQAADLGHGGAGALPHHQQHLLPRRARHHRRVRCDE